MPDYSKCVIYKIVCKDKDIKDCYVGSTCNHSRRKSHHKNLCNNEKNRAYNGKVYKFIRDNGGWDNFEFAIIEKYPCNDKVEKLIRERYWVELIGILNNNIPNRTEKEWQEGNEEKIKEYQKEYRKNNREKYRKEYNEEAKEYHKEKYRNNRQKRLEKAKEYRENNKNKILEKRRQSYTCITCNKTMNKSSKLRHNKSKTHLQNLQNSI